MNDTQPNPPSSESQSRQTPTGQPVHSQRPGHHPSCRRLGNRRLAALSLAVAVTAPVGMSAWSRLHLGAPILGGQPAMAQQQPALAPADALKQGVSQYQNGQYEEALATLQSIKADQLSDADRKTLYQTLSAADNAATSRKGARAEFDAGQEALRNNKPNDALTHYYNVVNNKYADEGTRQKAQEQIALANAQRQGTGQDSKSVYASAVSDYKSGNLASAKQKFQQLQAQNYKPGLFERSPSDYLKDIDRKMPQPSAAVAQAPSNPPAQAQGAPAPLHPAQTQAQAVAPAPAPSANASNNTPPAPTPPPANLAVAPAPTSSTPPTHAPTGNAPTGNAPTAHAPTAQSPTAQSAPAPSAPASPEQALAQTAQMQQSASSANAAKARELVAAGRAAEQNNDYATALNDYTQASQLDPGNAPARDGANRVQQLVSGRSAQPTSPLDKVAADIKARRQIVQYNFDTAMANARSDISASKFTDAQNALTQARNARNSDPTLFTQDELRQFDTQIADTQLALTTAQDKYNAVQAAKERENTQKAILAQQQQQQAEREHTVADLQTQARRLINETQYTQALGVLDQILAIDPTNDYATGVRPLVEDKSVTQQQRRYREDFNRQLEKQLNSTEEMKVPYDDILRYPNNWPDLSEMRDQTTALEPGHGQADQATQALLDRKLPELNFQAIGFSDVIDFLRDVTGANIFVNWRALEAAGIDRNTPVTSRLHDIRFSKALQTILSDVGGGTVKLGYTVDEGVITISTDEDLSKNVLTRVYDIRDLIIQVPDFNNAPTFDLQNQTNQTSGGGGGGGGSGGQSLFGGSGSGGNENDQQNQVTRQQLVDNITKLITDTVAPDTWRDAGGTVGSLRELQGQLIVTQTPENQRLLQGLLDQLRETRAIQVTVETRFLTVQRNYLEDIGFDLDVTLNNNHSMSDKLSVVPINQNSAVFTANPSTGLPGSIRNVNNGDVSGGLGALGLSSLGLTGTYLDNFTVQFLLRATQAEQKSTNVTAPRLTLFNGQRAFVLVSRQTAYVSNLTPVVATGAVAFNPTIGLVQSGVLLDVQATVSSDRKYVTLTLRPQLATLLDLLPFTFQSDTAANSGTTVPITNPNNNFTNFGTNAAAGTIQQPILQITEVRTTVSVPDGGTLLLGGQTLAGEIEREAGVPILSKIPFLKRLFTNRSTAKDEQILLILVKPTIVIQREQEQRQFPLMSTKVSK
jgi:general secretion pathway protein D